VTWGASRGGKHARYLLAAVSAHVTLGSALAAYALTLSKAALEILAAETLVFLMLLVTLSYVRNASEQHAVPIQGGSAAVSRGYLIFLMWAGLGYLAVLLSVGPAFSASAFIVFLFGFWALVAIFLVALVLWRRQKRRF